MSDTLTLDRVWEEFKKAGIEVKKEDIVKLPYHGVDADTNKIVFYAARSAVFVCTLEYNPSTNTCTVHQN